MKGIVYLVKIMRIGVSRTKDMREKVWIGFAVGIVDMILLYDFFHVYQVFIFKIKLN